MTTQQTDERICRKCSEPLAGWEHPAAKTCLKCRNPKAYKEKMAELEEEEENVETLGEVVGPDPEEARRLQNEPMLPPSRAPAPSPGPTNTPFFLKPGDQVSINLKQRKFLILPKSRWELNPRKWTGTIPDPIDPVELKMLRICLEAGDIVKGEVFTGIEKDETTLPKSAELLELGEVERRKALGLIVQHKGLIGGYMPYEIFRYLIRFEDDNEHRRPVMDFIQKALDFLGSGPPKSTPLIDKSIEDVTGRKFQ